MEERIYTHSLRTGLLMHPELGVTRKTYQWIIEEITQSLKAKYVSHTQTYFLKHFSGNFENFETS